MTGSSPGPRQGSVRPAGRDFALRRGSSISGTITGVLAPGTATPVAGAAVYAYALLGDTLTNSAGTSTNAAGEYSITGLPCGLYYLLVNPSFSNELLGQFYGGSPCGGGCDLAMPINGLPVAVGDGVPATGRDVSSPGAARSRGP